MTWDRQGEGTDQFRVYAAHFDGYVWSSEQRLDNDMASQDGGCSLALDANNLPWVVWQGMDSASDHGDIYCNRYVSAGIAESAAVTSPTATLPQTCLLPHGCAVRYVLLRPACVRLDVYSLAGRLVRSLGQSGQGAGRHTVVWNGRDSQGHAVSPGVYICRLQDGESKEAFKLVLVRD
jgi:hypothetical protein